MDGPALHEIERDPEGRVLGRTWWGGEGDDLFRTEDRTGHPPVLTEVRAAADGGAVATIRTEDVMQTVRLQVEEIENLDGSLTRVFVFPDGRTEAFTIDAEGRAVYHEAHAGTGLLSTATTEAVDDHRGGVVREEVVSTDEFGRSTVLRTLADGTTVEVLRAPWDPETGVVNETWTEPDGSRVLVRSEGGEPAWSTTVERSGASSLRGWEADGDLTERTLTADGLDTRVDVEAGRDPSRARRSSPPPRPRRPGSPCRPPWSPPPTVGRWRPRSAATAWPRPCAWRSATSATPTAPPPGSSPSPTGAPRP